MRKKKKIATCATKSQSSRCKPTPAGALFLIEQRGHERVAAEAAVFDAEAEPEPPGGRPSLRPLLRHPGFLSPRSWRGLQARHRRVPPRRHERTFSFNQVRSVAPARDRMRQTQPAGAFTRSARAAQARLGRRRGTAARKTPQITYFGHLYARPPVNKPDQATSHLARRSIHDR